MKLFLRLLPLVTALLVSIGVASYGQNSLSVESLPSVVRQGDVSLVIGSASRPLQSVHGEFRGQRLPMALLPGNGTFQGLLGIDMKTNPGTYRVTVIATTTDQEPLTKILPLGVERVSFATQRLTLPRHMVDLDPETLERVNREARRMNALLKGYREERFWKGPFIRPVDGEVTTPFGVRRILNGQPRNPHTGVDLRAQEGTPVRACNAGVVVLVDELFFNGKSVVLDHGWGMYSMYFHLSKTRVREGDAATRGDVLGLAGSTGRASGPHLHWGIRLNGARVNPLSLLKLSGYVKE